MDIGLGCAVENMILATQAEGFDVQLSLLPDSKYPDHVAHLASVVAADALMGNPARARDATAQSNV